MLPRFVKRYSTCEVGKCWRTACCTGSCGTGVSGRAKLWRRDALVYLYRSESRRERMTGGMLTRSRSRSSEAESSWKSAAAREWRLGIGEGEAVELILRP